MWPNFVAEFWAAHMGVEWELKFSPTWKVGGELHHLIRWSVSPLGKWVRRGVLHARSSSDDAAARTHACNARRRARRGLRD